MPAHLLLSALWFFLVLFSYYILKPARDTFAAEMRLFGPSSSPPPPPSPLLANRRPHHAAAVRPKRNVFHCRCHDVYG